MSVPGVVIASILFAAGLIGTVLPVLPGVMLIFVGTLVYGFMVDFQGGLNSYFYIGQGIAVALVFLVDYLAGTWGARRYGGSNRAVMGCLVGAVVGVLLLGPFGIVVGPFVGAGVGEFLNRRDLEAAFKAGFGTIIGFLGGTIAKLGIEAVMIFWFFSKIF